MPIHQEIKLTILFRHVFKCLGMGFHVKIVLQYWFLVVVTAAAPATTAQPVTSSAAWKEDQTLPSAMLTPTEPSLPGNLNILSHKGFKV